MKDVKKTNSGIPLIIILLVFAGLIFGGWWLYSSSKSPNRNANNANTPRNTQQNTEAYNSAPAGAQPPHYLGSATAAVTVEEFADFQCGACAGVHPVLKEVQSAYGSRIRMVFRHYPLQMHDKAYDAALAAEAAGMQGKFWQMQDQLFTNQTTWSSPSANYKQLWNEYAEKIGLDVAKWQSDQAGIAAKNRVDQDMARGRALNVSSTPTVFVNGQSIPYPELNVQALRRIIDAELQKTQAPATSAPPPAANTTGASNTSPTR